MRSDKTGRVRGGGGQVRCRHSSESAARAGRTFTRPAHLSATRSLVELVRATHSFPLFSPRPPDAMSSRHSFLSTTGLIRPGSALSVVTTAEGSAAPAHQHARSGSTKPGRKHTRTPAPATVPSKPLVTRAGIMPLGPGFFVCIAVFLSLLFVSVLSFAFISDEDERPAFADDLDWVAANTPGVSTQLLIACGRTGLPPSYSDRTCRRRRRCRCRRALVDNPLVHHRLRGCLRARRVRRDSRQQQLWASCDAAENFRRRVSARVTLSFRRCSQNDRASDPAVEYDPANLPFFSSNGKRHK